MRSIALAMILALVGACGSSSTSTSDGGGTGNDGGTASNDGGATNIASCDLTATSSTTLLKACYDYAWSGSDYSLAGLQAACTGEGGTNVSSCAHGVGGCKIVIVANSLSATAWFQTGNATSLAATCANTNGGTWINP
jgi:hypothetical protein